MNKTNDSVIFESREEIGAIIHALEQWQDDHPREDHKDVRRLVGLLDAIEMCW